MGPVVLHVISSGGFYGAERVLLALTAHLREAGWAPAIGVMESPGAEALLARAEALGVPAGRLPGALGSPLAMARALRACAGRRGAALIHTHGYKPDVLARLAGLAPARLMATCHSWYSDSLKLKVYEWLDKRALRGFDYVAAVSDEILADARRSGIAAERSGMILNGIALDAPAAGFERGRLRAELGARGEGERLILRTGRLAASKGNDVLLRALAALPAGTPPWRLALAGEGEERGALEALAGELGIAERVVFTGFRADAHDLLRAADLMAIPSLQEGLPIALLEAMAAGTPVVATAAGQTGTAIEDGRNGWLAAPGDAAALGRALGEALGSPDEARRRAAAAQADHAARYSQAAMGRAYMAVYRRVLGLPAAGQGGQS